MHQSRFLTMAVLVIAQCFSAVASAGQPVSSAAVSPPASLQSGETGSVSNKTITQTTSLISGFRNSWTNINLQSFGVPTDAVKARIRFHAATCQDGVTIYTRAFNGAPEFFVMHVAAYGGGDQISSSKVIEVPIRNARLQYRTTHGYCSQAAGAELVGYVQGEKVNYR